jgi:hypothetical protein
MGAQRPSGADKVEWVLQAWPLPDRLGSKVSLLRSCAIQECSGVPICAGSRRAATCKKAPQRLGSSCMGPLLPTPRLSSVSLPRTGLGPRRRHTSCNLHQGGRMMLMSTGFRMPWAGHHPRKQAGHGVRMDQGAAQFSGEELQGHSLQPGAGRPVRPAASELLYP